MAWTVTPRQAVNTGTTSAQTATGASATPTANSLLCAFFGAENDNHANAFNPVTPTGGGWTYTQRAVKGDTDVYQWNGTTGFRIGSCLYTAPVGGSPAAHTVVVDGYSGLTNVGFYGVICADVTGHDSASPIVQVATNGANIATASDSAAGTVTFGVAPTAGNLVLVWFFPGADTGGSPADPTAGGGNLFTDVLVHSTSGFTTSGLWSREWVGGESNTITCADLGQQVGSYTAIAVEIKAEDLAPWPPPDAPAGPAYPGVHLSGMIQASN